MLGRAIGVRSTKQPARCPPRAAAVCLAALGASLLAALAHAQSGPHPSAVIVLDSSRSMWGQIDGINKVVSARTAISEIAKRHQNKLALGVVAFGHGQSSGCKDFELVLEPKLHKPKEVANAVNALTPKGSTPIAEALATAAKAVEGAGPASIILISDGTDNCRGDPCATVERVKKKSPGLTFHAIGFDRTAKETLTPLRCIADNGGGTFTTAVNEGELTAALTGIVDAAVAPAPAPPPRTAAAPQPAAQPAPPAPRPAPSGTTIATRQPGPPLPAPAPSPQGEPPAAPASKADKGSPQVAVSNAPVPVILAARVTEGGATIRSGLVWRVFDARPGKDSRYKLISTHREATPTAALPPGDYLVNAAYGLSNLTKKISVQPGQSVHELFVLNTGGLRLTSVLSNGETIPPNSVRYDIYEDETDQFGNREKVLGDAKPGVIIRLNAGAYHVVSVYGDANAIVRADVAVEPGRLTDAAVNHSAAKVTFRLVQQPGGEALADTQWAILTPGGDVVKESAGALPSHILAAGQYTVLARHNGATYSQEFSVDTGQVAQVEVVMR